LPFIVLSDVHLVFALCRFHVLTEFDGGKRSCRRRLAGHNRRRRKAHPETHTTLSIKGLSPVPSDNSLTMEGKLLSSTLSCATKLVCRLLLFDLLLLFVAVSLVMCQTF